MGTQGSGRKRLPNRERLTAEDDALNQIAREAEARLAAKRAARAEAREIRMKELERQQKEIYQVQKKYYGLDTKWGDIEQWMEDSERYSRRSRRNTSASDEDERMSAGSRGSLRTNGYDGELYGSRSLNRRSGRGLSCSDFDFGLLSRGLAPKPLSVQNGNRPSYMYGAARPAGSYRASVSDESSLGGARRSSACGSHTLGGQPSEHSGHFKSSSRSSSRGSSARASPVVEERPEKDFTEKGSRGLPGLSAATLASLGGTSSRRGSGDTSTSIDTEASIREIKELNELKDQIQDVEGKYMQGLKEMKDSLAEVEEKYKKAMVSNAQLDNEKTNFMYQVDTLKDMMLELEEQLAESRRQYEEKSKEFEREKHAHSVLQFQFAEVKEALKQREEMLEEIRQLQQKQASYIREISDLQETIEWKDKKIGALERQKEFFDSVRSERDDLREEVVVLKEELKKHGIILNSEIATNGETSDPLNNVGYQGSTKMTQEELNALKATGDGTLGRANEVEVKNEMVEDEGKSEILQNSEQRQHKDDPGKGCVDTEVLHPGDSAEGQETSEDTAPSPGKGCVDTEVLHPGDNAEGQETSEGTAPSPGTLVNSENEVQSQILENTSFFENTQQVESSEVVNSELDGEIPGPRIGQGSSNALDIKNQSKESAEEWEKEKREDFETSLEGMSIEPRQESAPLQTSEVGRESSADTGKRSGNPTEAGPQAGLTGLGEQPGTVASSPPRGIDDTVSHREKRELDAPEGLDPSSGHDLEKELTNQEVAEPKEVPVQSTEGGGESDEEEGKGRKSRDEKPIKLEVQAIPCSPEARSSPQEVTGPSTVDAESEPLDAKEPDEEKNDQQGEALDSSHKKTKNKKKKNKKKRSPAPVETKDVQKELTFQSPDLSEVKEEQVKFTDKKPVVEAQNEVTENPKENPAVGSSKNADGPENPRIELDGGLNRDDFGVNTKTRKAVADGGTLDFEDTTVQSSGASASNKELEEGAMKDGAEEDGTAPSRPPGPDDEEVPGSAPLQDEDPAKNLNDGCQAEGTEEHVTSENLGQTVRKASDSISLENEDVGPAGEVGDCNSEGKEETTGEHGKGRNKEDCTLS
ncbi:leucine-rich repeat flightless-interacting protein 1 isoform X7 [Physeter macrocephalus]|uniref:Leucine-rich repeat flightless-interacting protein 1 isoform X7 n=1 Tax=Physeter macrocephalus TaxID=9755 RepID=A0A455AQ71_PHYMC|nr:leucine-rich repeat flightless-interacting protein 1 isoform X7 [Physeter catodon]|eukprot:XP_028338722.1 leucine-rich repeat flightless-interacting protein 1 isoform X7 [Physeter catodon]